MAQKQNAKQTPCQDEQEVHDTDFVTWTQKIKKNLFPQNVKNIEEVLMSMCEVQNMSQDI